MLTALFQVGKRKFNTLLQIVTNLVGVRLIDDVQIRKAE